VKPLSALHRLCAVLALLAFSGAEGARAQGASIEYQVKAAYLAKFAPFVEWPQGALAPGAPLILCAAGDDPFGPAFSALERQRVGDHPVVARRLSRVEAGVICHVLYLRGSSAQPVSEALAALQGAPILTVTDAASGDPARGVLHFVVAQNRVRFMVDAEAAAKNRLAISSKLQSLALVEQGSGS
jgi:hypothetical protein